MRKISRKSCTIVDSSNTIFFDVDDTLVLWGDLINKKDLVTIRYPEAQRLMPERYRLTPHRKHIDFLKNCHNKHKMVIVWSHGGWAWARAVVKALKLERYVTLIMDKPMQYVDDLDMNDWYSHRLYYDPKEDIKEEIENRNLKLKELGFQDIPKETKKNKIGRLTKKLLVDKDNS